MAAAAAECANEEVYVMQMWNLAEVARLKMDEAMREADVRRSASRRHQPSDK